MGDALDRNEIEKLVLEIVNTYQLSLGGLAETVFSEKMIYDMLYRIDDFEYNGSKFELIEQGGGEDHGSAADSIICWNGKFYCLDYSYYSSSGYDFDPVSVSQVYPVQKTITVYK